MTDADIRSAARIACDVVEAEGFDPAVVKLLRSACRPSVAEVLPLAIAFRKRWGNYPGGTFHGFFEKGEVSDVQIMDALAYHLTVNHDGTDDSGDDYDQSFSSLLLLMSPGQRRKVASRARQAVEAERRAANPPMTPGNVPSSGGRWDFAGPLTPIDNYDAVIEQSREYTVIDDPVIPNSGPSSQAADWWFSQRFNPPAINGTNRAIAAGTPVIRNADGTFSPARIEIPSHRPLTFEADGETFEFVESRDLISVSGRSNDQCIVGRSANGYNRRFSGQNLLGIRFLVPTEAIP